MRVIKRFMRKRSKLSLFPEKCSEGNEVIEALKNTDVMGMTPMDAMNLVYELVQKAKKL